MATTAPKSSTPRSASPRAATPKRKATPKAAAKTLIHPDGSFSEGAIVYTDHPRLHPAHGEAKVLSDFPATATYIKVGFADDGQAILVHRKRISAEPKS